MRGLRSLLASYVTVGVLPTTLHDEEPVWLTPNPRPPWPRPAAPVVRGLAGTVGADESRLWEYRTEPLDITLYVDGKAVGKGRAERTIPMAFSADEGLDIGRETGTCVSAK